MKRHIVFMVWKSQHSKDVNSRKVSYRFKIYQSKSQQHLFIYFFGLDYTISIAMEKLILKLYEREKVLEGLK